MLGGLFSKLPWTTGTGDPPKVPAEVRPHPVQAKWMHSGIYSIRALEPFARLELKFHLTTMLGRDMVAVATAMMSIAAAAEEPVQLNMRELYLTARQYVVRGDPGAAAAVKAAAGAVWDDTMRALFTLMPDERELHLPDFVSRPRPYLNAVAPLLKAIEHSQAMEIVRLLLLVRPESGSGLYVKNEPCKDESVINALVPHDDLEVIAFWALLFNLRPFTSAGSSTAPSPGQQGRAPAPGSTGRTPSPPGRPGGSSTSTGGRRTGSGS